MNSQTILSSLNRALPEPPLARYGSLALSLSVLSFLFSIALTQAALTRASLLFLIHYLKSRPRVFLPPVWLPLLFFCATTLLSVFFSGNLSLSSYAARKLVLFVILLLTLNLIVTRRHREFLLKALFVEAALVGLVAAVQVLLQYLQVRELAPEDFYLLMTHTRATGFLGHWMDYSGQQMMVLAVLTAFVLWRPKVKWGIVLFVVTVSLILSFTRGAWLGAAAGVVLLLSLKRPKLLWGLPVVGLAVVLVSPSLVRERVLSVFRPGEDPSINIRSEMAQVGWNMIREHPWLGVGPNRVDELYESYLPAGTEPIKGYHGHLHNNMLQIAASQGLPSLAAWVWLMALWGRQLFRLRRRLGKDGDAWIAAGALAAWLAFLVQGMFEFNFGSSEPLMLFLFLVSAPYTAAETLKDSSPDPDTSPATERKNAE
ncbi:MAG: O-antigen ligase [Acidobacteria bacterium]|nr:O-antigen ligase [Acidobacteriota bacterium]